MKFTGLHHITMITGDAQDNVDFYGDAPGPPPRQEDRQLRPARGLPPLLRRRAGRARLDPHLVRVPRRAAGPRRHRRRSTRSSSASPTRPRSTSGSSASRARRARGDGACASPTTTGSQLELVVADLGNAPLRAEHPEIPAEHAIVGLEGARAYGAFARRRGALLTDVARLHLRGRRRVPCSTAPSATSAGPTTRRRRAAAAGRGQRPPHRVGLAATRTTSRWQERIARRPAATSPTSATATTSSRSTSASRAASCSRSRRCAPASPSTRTRSTSARRCACRSSTSTCARSSSGRCAPWTTRARAGVEAA